MVRVKWLLSSAASRGRTAVESRWCTLLSRVPCARDTWKNASLLGTSSVSSRGTVSVVLAWSLPNLQSVPYRKADQSRNLVSICGLAGSVGFRRLGDS